MDSEYKNELSEIFIQVIEKIGLENAIKLAEIAGGGNLYIPKVDTIKRPEIETKIRSEFNGYNFRELALKYNKSESTIRVICKDIVESKRRHMPGQLSFL